MNEVLLKPLLPEIGKILRLFREKVARNQGEVARKAGISTSMLSQIERGAVSPSIDTLAAVCGSLDLSMADLFRRISPDAPVRVRHRGARLATQSRGVKFEQLAQSADAGYPAELLLLEIGPNKRAGFNGKGHEGVEMGYVLEGSAILLVDGTEYNLTQGDSVSYHSHMPHTIVNRGRGVFRAVWNALPPHRDYLEED
jgi:transcriptional regulator with XRE-family HTH domain